MWQVLGRHTKELADIMTNMSTLLMIALFALLAESAALLSIVMTFRPA